MALAKRTTSNALFVDISGKNGVIQLKDRDRNVVDTFDKLDGTIVDMEVVSNKYQGEDIHNLRMKVVDGDDTVFCSIALGSWLSAKLVGLINAADLNQKLSINVGMIKEGEKVGDRVYGQDTAWISVWQNGNKLAPDYGDGATELPEAPKVTVSGKTMTDMTPVNECVAALVGGMIAKLHPETEGQGDEQSLDPSEAAAAAHAQSQRVTT